MTPTAQVPAIVMDSERVRVGKNGVHLGDLIATRQVVTAGLAWDLVLLRNQVRPGGRGERYLELLVDTATQWDGTVRMAGCPAVLRVEGVE